MRTLTAGVLLAAGTLTAVPVPPPDRVDRPVARVAMLSAPLVVAPVVAACVGLAATVVAAGAPGLVGGFLCVALLALATRAIHLDGLADTADGLGVPGGRERALEIMKRGDVGPMGAAALVVVGGLQAAAIGDVLTRPWGWVPVTIAIAGSRVALAFVCTRFVRPARPGGLGQAVARTVPWPAALVSGIVVCGLVQWATFPAWGGLAALVALGATIGFVAFVVRRFGGMTGDVLGCSVEVAAMLLVVSLTLVV